LIDTVRSRALGTRVLRAFFVRSRISVLPPSTVTIHCKCELLHPKYAVLQLVYAL